MSFKTYLNKLHRLGNILNWIFCRKQKKLTTTPPSFQGHPTRILNSLSRLNSNISHEEIKNHNRLLPKTNTYPKHHSTYQTKALTLLNGFGMMLASCVMTAGNYIQEDCDSRPIYFTTLSEDSTPNGIYALTLQYDLSLACKWAINSLNNAACNISRLIIPPLPLSATISEHCFLDDNSYVPGEYTITLSTVNNTAANITKNLQCLINSLNNQCDNSEEKSIIDYVVAGVLLFIVATCIGVSIYGAGHYLKEKIELRRRRALQKAVDDELDRVMGNNKNLSYLIKEYAGSVPIRILRNANQLHQSSRPSTPTNFNTPEHKTSKNRNYGAIDINEHSINSPLLRM